MSVDKKYWVILSIGIGGAIGASVRYGIAQVIDFGILPYATILVNLLGCFILSYFSFNGYFKKSIPAPIFIGLSTGFIGSLTTFSTVIVETVSLSYVSLLTAILYPFIQICGGLLFCFFGYKTATIK